MAVSSTFTIRDAARNRNIPVTVTFPQGAVEPVPVVLFSPGGAVNEAGHEQNRSWGNTLASAGFAVIHLSVPEIASSAYCLEFQVPPPHCEPNDFNREVSDGGTLPAVYIARPRDATSVLDQLGFVATQIGVQLDQSRVAAGGFSGGAHTVMLLAGARVDLSSSVTGVSAADPRFIAFLAISPQGVDRLGLTSSSWNGISRPVLTQTGANDFAVNQTPFSRRDPYAFMPPGDKYEAFFASSQATHFAFSLEDSGNPLTVFIGRNGVAFLDAYLRGLPAARTWLTTNQLGIWSTSIGQMSSK